MKKLFYILICVLSLLGCSKTKVHSVQEYSKWINEPKNGLIKIKKIKGLEITVKYLPKEYLIYKELLGSENKSLENEKQLKTEYQNSLTFLMTIGPDINKKNTNDIMFENIKNYTEYTERLLSMNFEMDKNITLKTSHIEILPVLSNMENTYGLSKSRNILFVFSPNDIEKKSLQTDSFLDFVYQDELFSLGIMHFVFERKNLENLPEIH